jgi:hypothetical protein
MNHARADIRSNVEAAPNPGKPEPNSKSEARNLQQIQMFKRD